MLTLHGRQHDTMEPDILVLLCYKVLNIPSIWKSLTLAVFSFLMIPAAWFIIPNIESKCKYSIDVWVWLDEIKENISGD